MNADPLAQVGNDLRHTARVLRVNGLHQRNYYDFDQVYGDGVECSKARMCILGALHTAVTGHPIPPKVHTDQRVTDARRHLSDYLWQNYGVCTVVLWNDEPGRTAAQAALLLRRAAAWRPETER